MLPPIKLYGVFFLLVVGVSLSGASSGASSGVMLATGDSSSSSKGGGSKSRNLISRSRRQRFGGDIGGCDWPSYFLTRSIREPPITRVSGVLFISFAIGNIFFFFF